MSFDLARAGDAGLTVTINGELDITNVDALEAAVSSALERHPGRLIVELRGLRFADSSAIAWGSQDLSRFDQGATGRATATGP